MITTARSLAVGLTAWLLAFLIAYLGHINPTYLDAWGIALLMLSAVSGFLTAIAVGKRFCRHDFERGNAVTVFAIAFFAGIYAPITALWANARYFEWVVTEKPTAESHDIPQYLAPAMEHAGITHFAGGIVLLGVAWFIGRRFVSRRRGDFQQSKRIAVLDIVIGVFSMLVGLWMAALHGPLLTEVVQWLAYTGAAVLVSLLFRSIRVQLAGLRQLPPPVNDQGIPRKASVTGMISLWLCLGAFWITLLFVGGSMLAEYGKATFRLRPLAIPSTISVLWLLLPWVLFRLLAGTTQHSDEVRTQVMGKFAVRCGIWFGVAALFAMSGLILTGVAQNVLNRGPGIAYPFSLSVLALKPLYCISGLPAWIAWLGGFIIAGGLPKTVGGPQRVIACAQGGAAMALVFNYFLSLFALSVGLVVVPLIPAGEPLSPEVVLWFTEGNWWELGWFYCVFLATVSLLGAGLWAAEASIVSGLTWLVQRGRKIRPPYPRTSTSLPTAAETPPPAPTV